MKHEVPVCQCGVRAAIACPGAWEKGCDLGSNPDHVQAVDSSAQVEALRSEEPRTAADAYMVKGLPTGKATVILPEEFELVTQAFPEAVIAPLFLSLPEATAEPAAPEEPEEQGFVRMPGSQEEAINMLCVGHAWLAARNPRIAAMSTAGPAPEADPATESRRLVALKAANGSEHKPVAWIRKHPDGKLTSELLPDWAIEGARKESGAWVPLFTAVKVAPTQAAPAKLTASAVEHFAEVTAWRYANSRDPAHSHTYTFNRARLLMFARCLEVME